jgi:hypothetical protein
MKANTAFSHLLTAICIALLFSAPRAEAVFIAPTDHAPFRRDQLPIDKETMQQLSSQLATLCATLDAEDPAQQRTAAQFLALAQALDPVNRQAQDMLDQYSKEEAPAPPRSNDLTLAKTRAWRTQSWLASDEAGADGRSLSLCLGDVLAKVDPEHPSAAAYKSEQGKWTEWVAAADRFAKKEEPALADNGETSEEKMPDKEKEDDQNTDKEVTFALKSASISSPVMIYNEDSKDYDLKLLPVSLSTSIDEAHKEFRYHFKDVDENRIRPVLLAINKSTVPWLEGKFNGLPRGGVVNLALPPKEIYSVRRNGENISAAAAVLAHASLSGQEPTGIVIGIVQPDGKLALPTNGWQLIRSLSSAPPSRIVLPKSCAELLLGLLSLDDLAFFMKHDVLLADNIDDLVAYTKKTPDAALAAALSNFAGIREKATSSIGPFVTNQFVRGRLESIATAMPNYASAQYLLIQAKGKRPSQLSDKVVAHELRAALAPLKSLVDLYDDNDDKTWPSHVQMQAAHESCRAALDPLDRLIASSDRQIYGEAIDLANTARTLSRAIKKVSDKGYDDKNKGFHDKSLTESIDTLKQGVPDIDRKIGRILGEPASE